MLTLYSEIYLQMPENCRLEFSTAFFLLISIKCCNVDHSDYSDYITVRCTYGEPVPCACLYNSLQCVQLIIYGL